MIKMNKKAISPLIATILIIVVAVILVGILLSWSQTFVQKSTSEADSSIDTSCFGASLNIINCDYNSLGNEIKLNFVNSGSINFKKGSEFSLILIDADNNLNNVNDNILSSEALDVGESSSISITDYSGKGPIKLEIRNTHCPGYTWATKCH